MSAGDSGSAVGALRRELGVAGATLLGLGSILGTGVFVSIGIAAGVAGPAVIVAIALAAALATCNALSSAQLAAAQPVSGGTYEYGHRLLTPALGFVAGWMFLCAKTASAATAALGAAGYAMHLAGVEDGTSVLPWTGFVLATLITVLVLSGLRRTAAVNAAIVSFTLTALGGLIVAGLLNLAGAGGRGNLLPFFDAGEGGGPAPLLHATALMFVAYTGYARIATMGEEVTDPRRTIPRAIVATMLVSFLLYLLVALAALGAVGADALSGAAGDRGTPLERAAGALDVPGLTLLVAAGAVTAMLGVLLNLVLGLSRVALAMGRRHDLPPRFGRLSGGRTTPRSAIVLVGAAIAGLTLVGDVETTWGFSAFTVLIYYALTNLAALRLPAHQRLYARAFAWSGLAGCVSLTAFLPRDIWLPGLGLILLGLAWRAVSRRLWPHETGQRQRLPPG